MMYQPLGSTLSQTQFCGAGPSRISCWLAPLHPLMWLIALSSLMWTSLFRCGPIWSPDSLFTCMAHNFLVERLSIQLRSWIHPMIRTRVSLFGREILGEMRFEDLVPGSGTSQYIAPSRFTNRSSCSSER